jgi:hypothetical protein
LFQSELPAQVGRKRSLAPHLVLSCSGVACLRVEQAVDAMVAATAIEAAAQAEAADRAASVLIVTSDIPHLTRLVAGRIGVAVAHVGKLGSLL